jgi:hypothetical protein
MPLSIVPIYAAVLALGYVALSARVVRFRRANRVSLGSGGHGDLERRIRAHGNFAEYVPLALLLMALAEAGGQPAWLLHALGMLLVAGRAAHAYGLTNSDLRFRTFGVVATFTVLIGSAAALLRHAYFGG